MVVVRRAGLVLLVGSALLMSLLPATAAQAVTVRTYTYQVCRLGTVAADLTVFRRSVAATLADPRGWSRADVRFVERTPQCSRLDATSFTVHLAAPSVIGSYAGCSPTYSCRVGRRVMVNDARWRTGTPSYGGDLAAYRQMVVGHEVGHWLGRPHWTGTCRARTDRAPLMAQQSISLRGCSRNPWPLPWEVTAVRAHRP